MWPVQLCDLDFIKKNRGYDDVIVFVERFHCFKSLNKKIQTILRKKKLAQVYSNKERKNKNSKWKLTPKIKQ